MNRTVLIVIIAVAIAAGGFIAGRGTNRGHDPAAPAEGATEAREWTCSMHPQVRQPKPGRCPLCGMDLIPVSDDAADDAGPRSLKISPAARQLARVETAPVARRAVSVSVTMVGKVQYDETRLGYVTAWVAGRLDRLYVNYKGASVMKGQHMAWIYSPELLTAQEELLQALKAERELARSDIVSMRETARMTVDASRDKLRLFGLTPGQVAEIEERGTSREHVTINAPISGVVVHKDALEGMYIGTGTRIYTIADLTRLWVVFDAYESDLPWIRYGQSVSFTTESLPGESFTGTISFIQPFLDSTTRSVKVRVSVDNSDGRLKPDMFVRGSIEARMTADAKVIQPDLAGKWISPMHPEIVKDGPGQCDVCGMDLVPAEDLGYAATDATLPLVIPATAPLITGRRAVVYVEEDTGRYTGREVALGPRAGSWYLVNDGLAEGELVVTSGNFKIDSALQILAKTSMMSEDGREHAPAAPPERFETQPEFKRHAAAVFSAYFEMNDSLSRDDFDAARGAARNLIGAIDAVPMESLAGKAHMVWMGLQARLKKTATSMIEADGIEAFRKHLAVLSDGMLSITASFGIGNDGPVYRFHCPMALNDQGADWLQATPELANPYFGAAMLRCGELVETIAPAGHAYRQAGDEDDGGQ